MRGWIAEVAVDGPDRAAEDAIARSLGYSIGKLPLVPLVGPVVEHNPGVLEVYQTNTVYRSVAGASDFMADLAADAKLAETTVVTTDGRAEPKGIPVQLSGGDEDVAYEMPGYVGPDGATEAFFTFAVRLGRFVVQLSVQSGYGWTVLQAIAVLDQATAQLADSVRRHHTTILRGLNPRSAQLMTTEGPGATRAAWSHHRSLVTRLTTRPDSCRTSFAPAPGCR